MPPRSSRSSWSSRATTRTTRPRGRRRCATARRVEYDGTDFAGFQLQRRKPDGPGRTRGRARPPRHGASGSGRRGRTHGCRGVRGPYGGVISGTGALTQAGPGTLVLVGASTFAGATTVAAGTLVVNGSIGGSTVTVNAGGRLAGNGTLGSATIASGGTVAPGNSIGTLLVLGALEFAAGSTFEVELDATLASDLIQAGGVATINGGTVNALKAAGVYTPGSRWTILTAAGGVTGTFDALTQNMPFVDLALSYDPTHAYIDAVRNSVTFCALALTANQCAVGNGLASTGVGNAAYDAVSALPDAASARRAFNLLSGELHASARGVLIDNSRYLREATAARIRAAFGDLADASFPAMIYVDKGAEDAFANTDRLVDGARSSAHGGRRTATATPRRSTPRPAAFFWAPTGRPPTIRGSAWSPATVAPVLTSTTGRPPATATISTWASMAAGDGAP